MAVERLLVLAEDGRSFLSSQLRGRVTDMSWSLAGENVTCVCGSYCSQAYCVMGGRLFARETGDGTSGDWRPVNVDCNAVFAGRSTMVVQSSKGNAVRSSFDPFHPDCPQIGAWEVLPLLGGTPVTSCSRLLLSPRDHLIAVGDSGEVHLLRDTWVRLAPAPAGASGGLSTQRGFLGRARSFLQNLRRGKGRRFPAAFLGPNCLWVSSLSQPCLYRLGLGDLDSASVVKREVHEWASFRVEGGVRVATLAGSIHCSDMFWGTDQSGKLHEYMVDYTEGDMCVRPRVVSVVLEEGGALPPLVDVCLVSEVLGSPFQSILTSSGSKEEVGEVHYEEEVFVEAQGVSSLPGQQKLAYRYCCDEGDCDACCSMAAFRSTLPAFLPALPGDGEGVSMLGHSSAEAMLQWRKRPDPPQLASPPGSSRKRCKTEQLLNDHQVSGVEVTVSCNGVVHRAHQLLATSSPLPPDCQGQLVEEVLSVGDAAQGGNVLNFARKVLEENDELFCCPLQAVETVEDQLSPVHVLHSQQQRVNQKEWRGQPVATQSIEPETAAETVFYTAICTD